MTAYIGPNSEQVSAAQLPAGGRAIVNGRLVNVPAGGWIVTNPAGTQFVYDNATFGQNYQLPPITASQIGAANGVAALDGSGHVAQASAVNPATAGAADGVATLDGNSHVVQNPASLGQANGMVAIDANGHVSGATPGPAPTLAAQQGNTVSFVTPPTPTDRRGVVRIVTGSTPGAGQQAVITFGTAYASPPVVLVSVVHAGGVSNPPLPVDADAVTANSFAVYFGGTPAASNTFEIAYIVEA